MSPYKKALKTPAAEPRPGGRPQKNIFGKQTPVDLSDWSGKRVRVDEATEEPVEDADSLEMAKAITETPEVRLDKSRDPTRPRTDRDGTLGKNKMEIAVFSFIRSLILYLHILHSHLHLHILYFSRTHPPT